MWYNIEKLHFHAKVDHMTKYRSYFIKWIFFCYLFYFTLLFLL